MGYQVKRNHHLFSNLCEKNYTQGSFLAMAAREGEFRVLAVDDSSVDRRLIRMLLEKSSFKVTVADSPAHALEFLGSDNNMGFNLILTDYNMPGMTGYDLMMKVKDSSPPVKDIPVVVMSSEGEVGGMCLEQGAVYFFLKPVNLSHVAKLRNYLESRN